MYPLTLQFGGGGNVVGKGSGSHYNCPSLEVQIPGEEMGGEGGGETAVKI